MGLRRHVLNIGTLIGIIIFIAITIHFSICLWVKTDVFYIDFLRNNDVVSKLSFAIAILLLVIGGIIGAIAHQAFNRAHTEYNKIKYIEKSGVYKLVRHPFYLSMILIFITFVLLFKSYILLAACIASSLILVVEAQKEEKALIEKFGKEYLDYRKITGGFFPKIIRK